MKRILKSLAVVGFAAGLALSGCDRSPSQSGGGNQGGGGAPPPPPPAASYKWGLPIGDVSPNYNEKTVYERLHKGDCAGAQSDLDGFKAWQGFSSPRNVLLAQAAISFCRGDTATGTSLFKRAESMGWRGLLRGDGQAHASCEFYKSGASLMQQRPREDFTCPAGDPPPWKPGDQDQRQDPR